MLSRNVENGREMAQMAQMAGTYGVSTWWWGEHSHDNIHTSLVKICVSRKMSWDIKKCRKVLNLRDIEKCRKMLSLWDIKKCWKMLNCRDVSINIKHCKEMLRIVELAQDHLGQKWLGYVTKILQAWFWQLWLHCYFVLFWQAWLIKINTCKFNPKVLTIKMKWKESENDIGKFFEYFLAFQIIKGEWVVIDQEY